MYRLLFPVLVTFGPLLLLLVFGSTGRSNSFRRSPDGVSVPAIIFSLLFVATAVLVWLVAM